MRRALIAGLACLAPTAGLAGLALTAAPARAGTTPAPLPFLQSWSDTGQITVDDDWSGVTGVVGYRGDGLAAEPGADPRTVTADGSGTPLDVAANRTDPRAVGLAAGVAEFELSDPVVAIQGSATASAPHLLLSLDTRARAGVTVRLELRDIDATANDAVEPVAIQYRVGAAGAFAGVPGGYVADATSGPSEASRVTRVSVGLPAVADGQARVEVRVITTNAVGQDEWVGVDDIEVTASSVNGGDPGGCPGPSPVPSPAPGPGPDPGLGPVHDPGPSPTSPPTDAGPELTDFELSPDTFTPARRGPAIVHRGRAGAALRFRLSRAALVRFEVIRGVGAPEDLAPKIDRDESRFGPAPSTGGRFGPAPSAGGRLGPARSAGGGRFAVRGRRGLNRLRFSGRVRGRPLAPGVYTLTAVAVDRAGRTSPPAALRFRIRRRNH
jgi:hypothetical protein